MNITEASVMCPLTEEDIYTLLEAQGIRRNSRSDKDYEKAKRIVFKGEEIDPIEFEVAIKWIVRYVGV